MRTKGLQVSVVTLSLLPSLAFVMRYSQVAQAAPSVKPQQLVGSWYMGTMTGVDCDLKIRADKTLSVQTGGCFHRDPPVRSSWRIEGDKIIFSNRALDSSLGSHLRVARYKNNLVLVPQRSRRAPGQHKYSLYSNFWKKGKSGLSPVAYATVGLSKSKGTPN